MRKTRIVVSLLSVLFLGTGLLWDVSDPATNSLSAVFARLTIIAGGLILLVDFLLLAIYLIRQIRATEQQLRQQGIGGKTYWGLLRMNIKKIRPYKREVLLQFALIVSIGFVLLSQPIIGLVLPRIITYPTGPYTSDKYRQQQDYERNFPQTEMLIELTCALCYPAIILIYVCLTRDLTKRSETSA